MRKNTNKLINSIEEQVNELIQQAVNKALEEKKQATQEKRRATLEQKRQEEENERIAKNILEQERQDKIKQQWTDEQLKQICIHLLNTGYIYQALDKMKIEILNEVFERMIKTNKKRNNIVFVYSLVTIAGKAEQQTIFEYHLKRVLEDLEFSESK